MCLTLKLVLLSQQPLPKLRGNIFFHVPNFDPLKRVHSRQNLACLQFQSNSKWVHVILYLGSIDREVSIKANLFKYQNGSDGSDNWRFKHVISVH